MYVIGGKLQDYAWGIVDGLKSWRLEPQAEVTTGLPEAELWFGAHPNGPSPLIGEPGKTLADVVDVDQVPILVKLLAASKPLSLQIHPRVELAAKILERQEQDPSAPQLLSDPYAKTEMLIALTELSALLGLRSLNLAASLVDGIGEEGTAAAAFLRQGQVAEAIRVLIAADPDTVSQAEEELAQRVAAHDLGYYAVTAMQSVINNYPGDSGILVAALLEHHQLEPGEALYVPAGIVHAYVEGTGVEVMVASDNVLRMGLTPKIVAVDEALASLDIDLEPMTLSPSSETTSGGASTQTYAPTGSPFTVQAVEDGSTEIPSGQFRLILVTEGEITVSSGVNSVTAYQGQAVALVPNEPSVHLEANGKAFIAQSVSG